MAGQDGGEHPGWWRGSVPAVASGRQGDGGSCGSLPHRQPGASTPAALLPLAQRAQHGVVADARRMRAPVARRNPARAGHARQVGECLLAPCLCFVPPTRGTGASCNRCFAGPFAPGLWQQPWHCRRSSDSVQPACPKCYHQRNAPKQSARVRAGLPATARRTPQAEGACRGGFACYRTRNAPKQSAPAERRAGKAARRVESCTDRQAEGQADEWAGGRAEVRAGGLEGWRVGGYVVGWLVG